MVGRFMDVIRSDGSLLRCCMVQFKQERKRKNQKLEKERKKEKTTKASTYLPSSIKRAGNRGKVD